MIDRIKALKKEQLLIGILFGILLLVIMIPVSEETTEENEMQQQETEIKCNTDEKERMELQLKETLQKISGVGAVEVMITYRDYGKIIVEKDESISEEEIKENDSNGGERTTVTNREENQTVYSAGEEPYVIQELLPSVEGVLVVAEGGGNVLIKTQIQMTIEALFGLDTHKISIMKMEVIK